MNKWITFSMFMTVIFMYVRSNSKLKIVSQGMIQVRKKLLLSNDLNIEAVEITEIYLNKAGVGYDQY